MKLKLKAGTKLKILQINHNHSAGKRLIDMGLTPDTTVTIEQVAPFGDPYIIKVRNYLLAVRKKDLSAAKMEITP